VRGRALSLFIAETRAISAVDDSASAIVENETKTVEGGLVKRAKLGGNELHGWGDSRDAREEVVARVGTRKGASSIVSICDFVFVVKDDADKEQRYFNAMEEKEKVESHLTGITELKNVKVITCKKVGAL
jgi:hypothetical protein